MKDMKRSKVFPIRMTPKEYEKFKIAAIRMNIPGCQLVKEAVNFYLNYLSKKDEDKDFLEED